jgi:hypothetical protein
MVCEGPIFGDVANGGDPITTIAVVSKLAIRRQAAGDGHSLGSTALEETRSIRINYTIVFVSFEFHKRMIENDVQCTQKPTETFGARIARYVDPDGLVFSVGENRTGE